MTDCTVEKARKEIAGEKLEAEILKGFPGSGGVVEGSACVITNHDDLSTMRSGTILVCPYTSPSWSPIFPKIKGIVTDSGGMQTHAAITAREYGMPAVVGTWGATSFLKDGDIIRIKGATLPTGSSHKICSLNSAAHQDSSMSLRIFWPRKCQVSKM